MDESPVDAVRSKQDSSLVVMCKAGSQNGREQPLDAVISAGQYRRVCCRESNVFANVCRVYTDPGIAAAVPTFAGTVAFIDVGANIEPKSSAPCTIRCHGKSVCETNSWHRETLV